MKKWEIVYDYLLKRVMEYKNGDNQYLPSENALRNKFKISAQPVRKAFIQLVVDKLIESQQGKGYKILDKENNILFSFTNLFPQAVNKYIYYGKKIIDKEIREKTRFYFEDYVHEIRVERYIDDKLFVYQISYISDFLLKKDFNISYVQENGLMKYFLNRFKVTPKFSLKKILTVDRKKLEYEKLNLFKDDLLLLDKGMLFGGNQQLIEYRESYYNCDEFKWSFVEYYR